MNRLFVFFSIVAFFTQSAFSQDGIKDLKKISSKKKIEMDSVDWKHSGVFILNINQSAQSNWGSGGESFMFGTNTIFNRSVHHKKGKYFFDGYVDLEVGLVYATSYGEFRKTTDRFDLTADLEHQMGKSKHFSYGLLVNVNTQLFPGKEYVSDFHEKISNFLTPGKALISAGIEYRNIHPHTYFTAFVSPTTVRWVTKFDKDFYTKNRFGVDSLEKLYTELGSYISLHYHIKFTKHVSWLTRVDAFSNYKTGLDHIDFLVNNIASFSMNKWLAVSIMLDLLYDYDTKSALQVQQLTGIGLKLNL